VSHDDDDDTDNKSVRAVTVDQTINVVKPLHNRRHCAVALSLVAAPSPAPK